MFILYSFNGVEEYAVEDHEIARLTKPLFNLLGGSPSDMNICYDILKLAKANMQPGEIMYGDPHYILERVERYEDRKAFAKTRSSLSEDNFALFYKGGFGMKVVVTAIVAIVVCFVLWMFFFFERVANSDMPMWLKYLLLN